MGLIVIASLRAQLYYHLMQAVYLATQGSKAVISGNFFDSVLDCSLHALEF